MPSQMVFVAGDALVVRNEDQVAHQAGPSGVPAGTALTISLDRPTALRYACFFLPSGNLGLEVRPRIGPGMVLRHRVALGVPVGVGLSVVFYVASRL
ncbi:MAG: hypothetical protein QN141_10520 [Armatimonadota bacterium]|nr:hypothetical protein [Armatimonadota bacterium]MDR7451519.1 hypothetical protein [Armatimonadota bacterium]MDR7467486.1 hypothetical protein [Armatimonadota bacterium]MDR7499177.1 hypothetical protein [Armatimonadota bacterium]MDR7504904.1 hypothetical protein [Armatimonadota bacterium]